MFNVSVTWVVYIINNNRIIHDFQTKRRDADRLSRSKLLFIRIIARTNYCTSLKYIENTRIILYAIIVNVYA